jgi:hypothetical protein
VLDSLIDRKDDYVSDFDDNEEVSLSEEVEEEEEVEEGVEEEGV